MKKCLSCNNGINKIDHYVCNECYKLIKETKKELVKLEEKELKNEYYRWKRNLYLTKNENYKNEYQKKVIAIAEIYNEKYRKDIFINKIIDFSNNQKQLEMKEIKKSEEEIEDIFTIENKDDEVEIKNYKTWIKCKDGHRVISKSEKIIDDLLTEKGIRHSYDMEIDDNTNFRYDFKLLDYNIYIEHWGYKNRKNYEERKKIKKDYYLRNQYTLLESDEDSIKDTNNLIRELRKINPNIFNKNN